MKEFEGSSSVLVADVDCTAGGQGKCQEAAQNWRETQNWGKNPAASVGIHENSITYCGWKKSCTSW